MALGRVVAVLDTLQVVGHPRRIVRGIAIDRACCAGLVAVDRRLGNDVEAQRIAHRIEVRSYGSRIQTDRIDPRTANFGQMLGRGLGCAVFDAQTLLLAVDCELSLP